MKQSEHCVESCDHFPGYKKILNRCLLRQTDGQYSDNNDVNIFLTGVAEDLAKTWHAIFLTCIVTLFFSYILLILFRHAIKYVIWIIYIGIIFLLSVGSVTLFVLHMTLSHKSSDLLIGSGVLAIFAFVVGLLLFCFKKRIHFVIQLFKEASKALVDVPMLVTEPTLTFCSLIFACFVFIQFTIIIECSGIIVEVKDPHGKFVEVIFVKDSVMKLTKYVNLVALVWFTSFIIGCQHFVIASTVSQWFFTRSKDKLDAPISKAFSLLLNFHLGSICLGSILITFVKILRACVESIKVNYCTI